MKIAERSELPQESCWDLAPLYTSPEEWEKDFAKIDEYLERLMTFKGRLSESPETLKKAFEASDELSLLCEKAGVYAHLKKDENTSDAQNSGREDRISAKGAEISGETAWFEPELLAIPQEKFNLFRESETLKFYKRTLDEAERERKHTLSAKEERILGMSSELFEAGEKTFSMLNDADLRFPEITMPDGEKIEITHANYITLLENPERTVRRDAFNAVYSTYAAFKNTFATVLDTTVKANVLDAKIHRYDSTLQSALANDNIPVTVYSSLIDTVHKNLPVIHKYFALRAKALNLEKISMYDILNPLVPSATRTFTWEESASIVREACEVLGSEYSSVLKRAFDERWIDIYECRGKRSGAYSSGAYGYPPYLLLNHTGSLDSVFTLAHELGHSMHSHFSDSAQDYHYASYRIFAAEVASTTNELLVHHHLMKKAEGDDSFKAYLLNHLLDTMRGTIFRQTMFAEFERDIYEWSENGEPLTHEQLSNHYHKLNGIYHGDSVVNDDFIRCEWERIPHFHYGFYVYKYATGMSAAAKLASDIIQGKTERYFGFLKAGDSKDVIDIMKDAGVDFSTPAPVEAAMKLFEKSSEELSTLIAKDLKFK